MSSTGSALLLLLLAAVAPGAKSANFVSTGNGVPALEPLGPVVTGRGAAERPNIVFILTDDQDQRLGSLDYLPLIKKHLADAGTTYTRHYCTTAICCPSRVSLWTGKLAHNTNVTNVSPPYGGYPKFLTQGLNDKYLPVWLQEAGYNTYYTGKLFNAHSIDNYNKPFPRGWNHSDFQLDPYTYRYLNTTFQRDQDPPRSYEGQYSPDVLASKALGFIDDAAESLKPENGGRPFFIGLAPIAPHSDVASDRGNGKAAISAPVAAKRHENLFADVKVPRTANFNPDAPSGVSWVSRLQKLNDTNVEANDHFYRQRLRALQSVDEMVDNVFASLEKHGLLDNTYVFYTSDNGFHISQHRLQPGKTCGFEEDINVPLLVRGPGIAAGLVQDSLVTVHADLAPTILTLAGAPLRDDFDGEAIPLTSPTQNTTAAQPRHEHVTVEFWGGAGIAEGDNHFDFGETKGPSGAKNTYKAVRVVAQSYNLYYSVWCSGEHELYDLAADPYQINNLLANGTDTGTGPTVAGVDLARLAPRLDALLLVLKSCKGKTCVRPWEALHPAGDVATLADALDPGFDDFYGKEQTKVAFSRCEAGQILASEGPMFETEGAVYRRGTTWDDWV
ncbi:hypothetical protein GGTG_12447 [Gaeumannomyces tritici R3-111a-1]|uniref:Arylsulfatase n=1 Tax=Gaeumannomyces tritici (strain R3-111a-1) TaxID=644352 RepID=J3PG21_GAET3|nr:hypothetical protein GGTG_12447 [Gaeumannomyces tritici R3-111a-1]EJT70274.1 hypothetical protein GGTG_12447 [Gaeumannomyces tritici R3-111a-1]